MDIEAFKDKYEHKKVIENTNSVEIIRAANIFGFNRNFRLDSVLNNFIFNGLVYKKILIYGNGDQKRPFASLNNLVKLLTRSVEGKKPQVFIILLNLMQV